MANTGTGIEIKRRYKTFRDVSLSWEPNPISGDLTTITNERSVSNALKNIITIIVGEVPFDNSVGSYVTSYLFENYGPAMTMLLKQEIERSIKRNEPRVEVEKITVELQGYEDQLWVQIEYRIIGYDEIHTVSTLLSATR